MKTREKQLNDFILKSKHINDKQIGKEFGDCLLEYQDNYTYLEKFILTYLFLFSSMGKNHPMIKSNTDWHFICLGEYAKGYIDELDFKDYCYQLYNKFNIPTIYLEPTISTIVDEFGNLKQLK